MQSLLFVRTAEVAGDAVSVRVHFSPSAECVYNKSTHELMYFEEHAGPQSAITSIGHEHFKVTLPLNKSKTYIFRVVARCDLTTQVASAHYIPGTRGKEIICGLLHTAFDYIH